MDRLIHVKYVKFNTNVPSICVIFGMNSINHFFKRYLFQDIIARARNSFIQYILLFNLAFISTKNFLRLIKRIDE